MLEDIKDIVIIVAAIAANIIGFMGLRTWRKQLRGTTEYTLAKSILSLIYQLRKAISDVRNPFMLLAPEADLPPDKLEKLTREEKEWHGLVQAYQKRWQPISEATTKLQTSVFEAEAVWSHDVVDKIHPLFRAIKELWLAIREYIDIQNPNLTNIGSSSNAAKKREAILYEGDPKTDEFRIQLDEAIRNIENELRPHIAQHHK